MIQLLSMQHVVRSVEVLLIFVLNNGADINISHFQIMSIFFYLACENGHEIIVQLLLDYGVDKNLKTREGSYTLAIAYQNGSDGIQNLLQRI